MPSVRRAGPGDADLVRYLLGDPTTRRNSEEFIAGDPPHERVCRVTYLRRWWKPHDAAVELSHLPPHDPAVTRDLLAAVLARLRERGWPSVHGHWRDVEGVDPAAMEQLGFVHDETGWRATL
jgi:hypothetical protein